ncbi:MAG: D-alanyl-lipoteichoic acid biosynthesis protein DltD [[Clostridium] scindens]
MARNAVPSQNMFKGNVFQPMLLGAGHYQSLSHAITLAAIEPAMENRKVVLLVSPNGSSPWDSAEHARQIL